MFHLMLVLPGLILLAIIFFVVLFSVIAIVSTLIGGATASILIKNKKTKKLLLIGLGILFLVGCLFLSPIITTYFSMPLTLLDAILIVIFISITLLSIGGIKLSISLKNKISKISLSIAFCIVLATNSLIAILTVLAKCFFPLE